MATASRVHDAVILPMVATFARYRPRMTTNVSAHDVRRIAVAAMTDPRTIQRYLKGEPIRSTSKARIDAAVLTLGIPAPSAPAAQGKTMDEDRVARLLQSGVIT